MNMNLNQNESTEKTLLFYKEKCTIIKEKLNNCMRINKENAISCGDFYKAYNKCEEFITKLNK